MSTLHDKRYQLFGYYFSLFDCLLVVLGLYGVLMFPLERWIGFGVLILAVVIHEVAHGWVAYRLGDPTAKTEGRLSLNPLVHVDPLGTVILPLILVVSGAPFLFGWAKPVPVVPRYFKQPIVGMMWVALAGPAVNVMMAWGCAVGVRSMVLGQGVPFDNLMVQALYGAMVINLVLAIFNMSPSPPLDGSRVVTVFLPAAARRLWFQLERYGLFIVMAGVYFGLFDGVLNRSLTFFLTLFFN